MYSKEQDATPSDASPVSAEKSTQDGEKSGGVGPHVIEGDCEQDRDGFMGFKKDPQERERGSLSEKYSGGRRNSALRKVRCGNSLDTPGAFPVGTEEQVFDCPIKILFANTVTLIFVQWRLSGECQREVPNDCPDDAVMSRPQITIGQGTRRRSVPTFPYMIEAIRGQHPKSVLKFEVPYDRVPQNGESRWRDDARSAVTGGRWITQILLKRGA